MPRKLNKVYDPDKIAQAVQNVRSEMSYREAEMKYGITWTVIHRHATKPHTQKKGKPPVLTSTEEQMILNRPNTAAEWGFPLTGLYVRMPIKGYLDRCGRNVKIFKENLPDSYTGQLVD